MGTDEKIKLLHDFWDKQRPTGNREFEKNQKEKAAAIQDRIKTKLNQIVGRVHTEIYASRAP
jgi:hypothetical protein